MKRGLCGIPGLYMMLVTFLQPKVAGGAKDGEHKSWSFQCRTQEITLPEDSLD